MITELELERLASAIDRAFRESSGLSGATSTWAQVQRLRLHADLLDRLAAQYDWSGSISRRAEVIRDSAEQLADRINGVDGALGAQGFPAVRACTNLNRSGVGLTPADGA